MENRFTEALASGRILIGDGAMGSELQARGLAGGDCGVQWNLTHPDKVLEIHRGYVEAGCDILLTNTFGANGPQLRKFHMDGSVEKICRAGVKLAREAIGDAGIVLGDIGPSGEMIEPIGNFSTGDFEEVFGEVAAGFVQAGVDALIVETMIAIEECEAAVRACKAAGELPVIASMAFEPTAGGDFRTMMGIDVPTFVRRAAAAGANVVGANCGCSIEHMVKIIERVAQVTELPIMAQPNAGMPRLERGVTVYDETPEQFAALVPALLEAGADIVGSCCGTDPAFTRKIVEVVRGGG